MHKSETDIQRSVCGSMVSWLHTAAHKSLFSAAEILPEYNQM